MDNPGGIHSQTERIILEQQSILKTKSIQDV